MLNRQSSFQIKNFDTGWNLFSLSAGIDINFLTDMFTKSRQCVHSVRLTAFCVQENRMPFQLQQQLLPEAKLGQATKANVSEHDWQPTPMAGKAEATSKLQKTSSSCRPPKRREAPLLHQGAHCQYQLKLRR